MNQNDWRPGVSSPGASAAIRSQRARDGLCIDCGVEARPLRIHVSPTRERLHHRCNACYRLWCRRRGLWTRLRSCAARHRRPLERRDKCSSCHVVSEPGAFGYFLYAADGSSEYVCALCHEDVQRQFGGQPASIAEVRILDRSTGGRSRRPLYVGLAAECDGSVVGLRAAAERLLWEFGADFPPAVVSELGLHGPPGRIDVGLVVWPPRLTWNVLYPLVETATVVLRASSVVLAFEKRVRELVRSDIYHVYGRSYARVVRGPMAVDW